MVPGQAEEWKTVAFPRWKKGQVNPKGKEQITKSHPIKVMLFNAASDKFLKTRDSHYKGAENSGASVVIASGKGKSIATCEIDPPSDASPSTGLRKRPISKRPNNKTLYLGSAYNTRTTILKLKFTRTGLEPTQAKGKNYPAKLNGFSFFYP